MNETIQKLRAVFPESAIAWRVGRTRGDKAEGQALPYIDNRVVQNRLDEALGPENWESSFQEVVAGTRLVAVRCKLSIRVDGQWVSKEDAAPLDTSSELAIKGVYSDAMKRAAVQWGLGRYLYHFVAPWIALDPQGQLTRIPTLEEGMRPSGSRTSTAGVEAPPTDAAVSAAQGQDSPAGAAEQPVVAEQETPADKAAGEVLRPSAEGVKAETSAQSSQETTASPAPAQSVKLEAAAASEAPKAASAEIPDEADSNAKRSALYEELLVKLAKLPPKMIKTYITGPKGMEKLTAAERTLLLAKVAEREAAATPA